MKIRVIYSLKKGVAILETLIKKFLSIDWKIQLLMVSCGATIVALTIALSIALPLYVRLTGLDASQGFIDTVIITAIFTAIMVAFPIVFFLLQ